jgi:hypothetical protein
MMWSNIPKFPQIHYRVTVPFSYLLDHLQKFEEEYHLDLNPDFQRGHVWSEEQQIAFIEFAVREPQSGMEIYFNHPGWMSKFKGDFVLVDGKQRIEAARRFLMGEIPVYGHYIKEFTHYSADAPIRHSPKKSVPNDICFYFNIAKLPTRADVLKWYLDFNAGGTPHAKEEIERVRKLLKEEQK